jgi:hypothetical protein
VLWISGLMIVHFASSWIMASTPGISPPAILSKADLTYESVMGMYTA